MGIITSDSWSKALWPGVKAWWGTAYDEHKTEFTDIFSEESSDKASEETVGTSYFGLAQVKPTGNPISYDEAKQTFINRVTHVIYGLGFIITREQYEDGQYPKLAKQFSKALAFSMRQTKEIVGANLINRAFDTNYTFGDGKPLIATDHPNWNGGTWSNYLSTGASDLTQAAIEQMCIDIMGATNDRGLKISLMPRSLHIAPQNVFEAERILKSSLEFDTSNNAINVLKSMNIFPEGIKVNHYFTDPDAWFVKTNAQDGLKYYNRRAVEFKQDNEFDTENAKYKATERYSFTCDDPRSLFGSAGI